MFVGKYIFANESNCIWSTKELVGSMETIECELSRNKMRRLGLELDHSYKDIICHQWVV